MTYKFSSGDLVAFSTFAKSCVDPKTNLLQAPCTVNRNPENATFDPNAVGLVCRSWHASSGLEIYEVVFGDRTYELMGIMLERVSNQQ